jgi:hypothetical protein
MHLKNPLPLLIDCISNNEYHSYRGQGRRYESGFPGPSDRSSWITSLRALSIFLDWLQLLRGGEDTAAALLSSTWFKEDSLCWSPSVDSSLERRRERDIARTAGSVALILLVWGLCPWGETCFNFC